MLKIYLISQDNLNGYDTYDSAVVVAKTESEAKLIHPNGNRWNAEKQAWYWKDIPMYSHDWCNPKYVEVDEIGTANNNQKEGEIICTSFNAG